MTAEEVGEDMCPVLVGYDYDLRGVWAIAVEAKGPVKSSVQFVKGKIDDAGCSGTAVSIRSDLEKSILVLKSAVAIYRQAVAVMLESPARDSKANGAAERAAEWSKEALVKVGCTPYDIHQPREPEVVFREMTLEKVEKPEQLISMARQVYIKPKDIQRYGLTRGCKECGRELNYGPRRKSAPHSKTCRERIMKELAKTDEGRSRIAVAATKRHDSQ